MTQHGIYQIPLFRDCSEKEEKKTMIKASFGGNDAKIS